MNGDQKLERYLNSACTGLFGLERETVHDELEANLLERVRDFQVMGCAREKALERALEEFGAPGRVSRGMREVYILPSVLKGGALLGVLSMGAYLAVGSSVAGPVPISLCLNMTLEANSQSSGSQSLDSAATAALTKIMSQNQECTSVMAFLKLEDIRADFARQGYTLKTTLNTFTLEHGQKRVMDLKWTDINEATLNVGGEDYLNLESLFTFDGDTQRVQVPVTFDQLLNPTLNLGGAKLRPINVLGKKAVDVTLPVAWRIAFLVRQAIDPQMKQFGYGNAVRAWGNSYSFSPPRDYTHTLGRVGKPGKVYALTWIREGMTVLPGNEQERMNAFIETSLATADAQGTLKFGAYLPKLEYTNSLEGFRKARGQKAILLELTGRLDNAAPAFTVMQNPPSSSRGR